MLISQVFTLYRLSRPVAAPAAYPRGAERGVLETQCLSGHPSAFEAVPDPCLVHAPGAPQGSLPPAGTTCAALEPGKSQRVGLRLDRELPDVLIQSGCMHTRRGRRDNRNPGTSPHLVSSESPEPSGFTFRCFCAYANSFPSGNYSGDSPEDAASPYRGTSSSRRGTSGLPESC